MVLRLVSKSNEHGIIKSDTSSPTSKNISN